MSDDECDIDNGIIKCWCGVEGTYEELFSDSCDEGGCSGSGVITCICGGDFCVCHHHGECECPGCDACERDDDCDYGMDDDE